MEYFQQLFSSLNPNLADVEVVLEATPQDVTHEMNQALLASFTKTKVDLALKQMSPLKAPRTDGMPPSFISIIGIVLGWMFLKRFSLV